MERLLVIQTAFIGDVILATPVIEKLHRFFPDVKIDFLLRKGNEGLLHEHPLLNEILIWNKSSGKYSALLQIIRKVRGAHYDAVINLQRFFSSGLITTLSGAKTKIGFDKNPLAGFFSQRLPHIIGTVEEPIHEIERNLGLIEHLTDGSVVKPRLYPGADDFEQVERNKPYICVAPTSVWYTKQLPEDKWVGLIDATAESYDVLLIGGRDDRAACDRIVGECERGNVENLAGTLTFLQSAALMANAAMNYVNDSAPLHMASAMNAPVTAVFCSTVPAFGFGPLSDNYHIVESAEHLDCRPCGLHGYKACPKGHFKCADLIVQPVLGDEE